MKIFADLPLELRLKIQMYSHPILDKKIQQQIMNYKFRRIYVRNEFCRFCERYHKIPRYH